MYQAEALWAHGHCVAACLLARRLAEQILTDLEEVNDDAMTPDVSYCAEGAAYPACWCVWVCVCMCE